MGEYWDAKVTVEYAPYPHGLRYFPDWANSYEYEPTRPPSDENETTIEQIRQQLLGQHPEDISLLADLWQNAVDLLKNMKSQLFSQSSMLSDAWQSSSNDARDLFLKTGPGKTLAYLDEWITAAENNRDALRGLVLVAQESRKKINGLWEDYKKDIEDAKNVGFGTTARIWLTRYDLIRGGEEYEAAMDEHREQQIQEVRKRYNREAQQLASDTATHYFEYLTKNGYGPPFEPMNATMNIPGEGLWSRIPSGPSGPPGMPNAGAPPSVGTVRQPPGMNLTAVPPPAQFQGRYTAPPGGLTAPVGTPGITPPPALPAGGLTPPAGLVVPPPIAPGAAAAAAAAASRLPTPSGVPAGGGRPAGLPAALRNGVLQRPTLGAPPGAGSVPGAGAMPPGARPPAPPVLNRPTSQAARGGGPNSFGQPGQPALGRPQGPPAGSPPPPLGRPTGRQPTRGGAPGQPGQPAPGRPQGPFAGAPPSTSPPVLRNRPPQQRPGSREELLGTSRTGNQRPGGPIPGGGRPTPPVFSAPQRPSEPAPKQPSRGGRREETPPAGQDWVGAGEARADAATPVFGAPAAPVTGAAVSKLEEVPSKLRNAARGPMPRHARPDTVAAELTARRTSRGPSAEPVTAAEELDEQRIVTDEQAFSVPTPGGGVLTQQRESPDYRPEPPAAIGGR